MTMFLAVTFSPPTVTVWASANAARPFSHVTLFFLNRNSIPPVSCLTASLPLAVHDRQVERGRHVDAELGHRAIGGVIEQLGRVQHRLRRNAADVEAGAAERLAAFGARGLQPQLRGADRGDVAAGAGADHQDVIIVFSHWLHLMYPREGGSSWAPAFAGAEAYYRSIKMRVGSSIAFFSATRKVTASRPSIRRWS